MYLSWALLALIDDVFDDLTLDVYMMFDWCEQAMYLPWALFALIDDDLTLDVYMMFDLVCAGHVLALGSVCFQPHHRQWVSHQMCWKDKGHS